MINGRHRLPSGFGTIRNLGEGRRRPYAVHPPAVFYQTTEGEEKTGWKRPPAICYVASWDSGLKVLALFHAGMYKSGMEELVDGGTPIELPETKEILCDYCQQVLDDMEKIKNGEFLDKKKKDSEVPTFEEVYASFYEHKFGEHAQRKLSVAARRSTDSAYKRFKPFYKLTLDEITVDSLQEMVNQQADEGFSKTTLSRVVTLAHQIWKYAYPRGWCNKETGRYVEMPAAKEEEHHQDFTDEELKKLWEKKDDPVVKNILVMCYSGFRVNEYKAENFQINLDKGFFQGGFKTEAGRDRIVPIHSAIKDLVKDLDGSFFCGKGSGRFRFDMKDKLFELGIDGGERYHTPHSCRHTFSRLCESFSVNEADRKRMMGHSLRNDVTNGVYGHRTVRELTEQLEKIMTFSL
ncbi:MAG: integrase [Blautia sp.]|nr:integrase [Blautia sp.]